MRAWQDYADRLYLQPSGPAHIVPWGTDVSLCGIRASNLDWYGTGDWDEREFAAQIILCPACLDMAHPLPAVSPDEDPAVADWRSVLTSTQP
jgi:hypothetical protein